MKIGIVIAAGGLAAAAIGAQAQSTSANATVTPPRQVAPSSITLYGNIDQYFNYMHSSSGATLKTLNDGAYLRSRWGVRGVEDLGGDLAAKFQLESGFFSDTGGLADTARSFDRQAWVGLAGGFGEVRLGRQNTAIFYRGDYINFGSRTLGSMVNNFGVPSRYDNDISWLSPRYAGVMVELHYALGESSAGIKRLAVYQAAVDYLYGPYRVGYAGLRANPPAGATVPTKAAYDNVYANYDWGKGKVYLTYVRSNNSASTAVSNNAGTIVGNVGALVAGNLTDANRYYNIVQVSADWNITPVLRVGALWGRIGDTSGANRSANGGSIGAFYSLSKRTTLMALADTLRNNANGGWRPAGSAGLTPNFATPNDVNGRTINGLQAGIIHRF